MMDLEKFFQKAKIVSRKMAFFSSQEKNAILFQMANSLRKNSEKIIEENKKDILEAEKNNLGNMIDRLLLNTNRIEGIALDIEKVAVLHDFVGETLSEEKRPTGILVKKIRVPLGVIAMIYESRPNVTVDASVLSLKSGNAILLKGGKESQHSNKILANIMREILAQYGVEDAVQLLEGISREDTLALLEAKGKIDLLIPRGGRGLIDFVNKNARVPIIETGASVVHTFVDESADFEMAKNIIINEKIRRVSVCNALDTLLIHQKIAPQFFSFCAKEFEKQNITLHTDKESFCYLEKIGYPYLKPILEEEFFTEWLDYDLSIKIVRHLDEALDHIEKYSLGHSESIITNNKENAERFLKEVDAACVYHNTSTSFSDGGQFGLGAEIGISTQKLHARGPFALQALTCEKWVINGNGEIRL